MYTITVNQAEMNIREIIQNVLDNIEPTIVMSENGESIVMISLEEYNAWQETLYLFSTPANAEHLAQSIAEDKAGYTTEQELIEP